VGVAVGVDAQQVQEEDVLILLQNVLQAGVGPGRLEKRLGGRTREDEEHERTPIIPPGVSMISQAVSESLWNGPHLTSQVGVSTQMYGGYRKSSNNGRGLYLLSRKQHQAFIGGRPLFLKIKLSST